MKNPKNTTSLPVLDEEEFLKDMSEQITANNHKKFFQDLLKKYSDYKHFFKDVFIQPKDPKCIYTFRASYIHHEKGRPLWREIDILGNQTLEELAEAVVYSMDWANDHLHSFRFSPERVKPKDYFRRDFTIMMDFEEKDGHPEYLTNQVLVSHVNYERFSTMRFEFDFGDCHEFNIDFKGVRTIGEGEKVTGFPRLVDQRGVAQPQYMDWDEEEGEMSPEEEAFLEEIG